MFDYGLGGWGMPNDYVIAQNWTGLSIMFDYKVDGLVGSKRLKY